MTTLLDWSFQQITVILKKMSFRINEQCTACDACRPVCPTGSIFALSPTYRIDSDTCRGCQLCLGVCPVSAIVPLREKTKRKPSKSPDHSED